LQQLVQRDAHAVAADVQRHERRQILTTARRAIAAPPGCLSVAWASGACVPSLISFERAWGDAPCYAEKLSLLVHQSLVLIEREARDLPQRLLHRSFCGPMRRQDQRHQA